MWQGNTGVFFSPMELPSNTQKIGHLSFVNNYYWQKFQKCPVATQLLRMIRASKLSSSHFCSLGVTCFVKEPHTTEPFESQKWLRGIFFIKYPYTISQTGNENN